MSTAVATWHVNYSEHLADTTGSPETPTKSANKEVMPSYGGGSEQCARCSKVVYLAEKQNGAGRAFHSKCFSCRTCNRKLDASRLSEHKGEIYCKNCYTKQFGVHGLANGVTMTTENVKHENLSIRRSSFSNDTEAPAAAHRQTLQRTHSNDVLLRGEHSAIYDDEVQKRFPWKNEFMPSNASLEKNNLNTETDHVRSRQFHRKSSPIGFQRVTELDPNDNHYRRSANHEHLNHSGYATDEDQEIIATRISTIVQTPTAAPPNRINSTIEQIAAPLSPVKTNQRYQEPSKVPTTESYQQLNNHRHSTNRSDDYSLSTLNELNHTVYHENASDHYVNSNMIVTQNPVVKNKYSHSASYEEQQRNPATQVSYREQSNPRHSSSSTYFDDNQRPLPSNNHSSSKYRNSSQHDSTVPTSGSPPAYNYLTPQSSHISQAGVVDRYPATNGQRTGSAVNELVARSSRLVLPETDDKYSAIGALAHNFRPTIHGNPPNNNDFGY